MPHVTWSPGAQRDLYRLYRFLREKNQRAAQRAVEAIQGGVRFLGNFPEAGYSVERYGPGRREWPVNFGDSGYLILYRFDGTEVLIAAIRHGKERGYRGLSAS